MTPQPAPRNRPLLEIAVQDAAGAATAVRNGADRLELCVALATTGGLTPSLGLVESVCEAVKLATKETAQQTDSAQRVPGVAVLIRPREGGFVYTNAELAVMERDIAEVSRVGGVEAVVLGALGDDGTIDLRAMSRLIAAAGNTDVVFHRAIDALENPETAVRHIRELGCARILSSGGAAKTADGVAMLTQMVGAAEGAVQVMAGGGVELETIPALLEAGVDAIHLSAKSSMPSTPSGPGGGADQIPVTDGELVRACAERIQELTGQTATVS